MARRLTKTPRKGLKSGKTTAATEKDPLSTPRRSSREYSANGELVSVKPNGIPMYYDGVVNSRKTRRSYGLGLLIPKQLVDVRVEFRLTREEQIKFVLMLRLAKVSKQRFLRGLVLELIESMERKDAPKE